MEYHYEMIIKLPREQVREKIPLRTLQISVELMCNHYFLKVKNIINSLKSPVIFNIIKILFVFFENASIFLKKFLSIF